MKSHPIDNPRNLHDSGGTHHTGDTTMTKINTGGQVYPSDCVYVNGVVIPAHTLATDGMTKREVAAIAAMQGILAGAGTLPSAYTARAAVEYADAIIDALGAGK